MQPNKDPKPTNILPHQVTIEYPLPRSASSLSISESPPSTSSPNLGLTESTNSQVQPQQGDPPSSSPSNTRQSGLKSCTCTLL